MVNNHSIPLFFYLRGVSMNFDAGTWWLIAILAGLAISIIGYFLKRTMEQVDEHDKDIQNIQQKGITKDDHKQSLKECQEDIKQIRQDYTPRSVHSKDMDECRQEIKGIKEDYSTKSDLKDLKQEVKSDLQQLMDDISDIKENSLRRDDFFRAQLSNEKNFQRLYDLFLTSGGGTRDG